MRQPLAHLRWGSRSLSARRGSVASQVSKHRGPGSRQLLLKTTVILSERSESKDLRLLFGFLRRQSFENPRARIFGPGVFNVYTFVCPSKMKEKSTIVRHTLSEIKALREQGHDQTRPHAPAAKSLGADFWKAARVVVPAGESLVHLRLDSDIVDWFKSHGKGHLTRMNAVLRTYVEAQKHSA